MFKYFFFILSFFCFSINVHAQESGFGNLDLDDFLRRKSILDIENKSSWMLRSFNSSEDLFISSDSVLEENRTFEFKLLPLYLKSRLDGKRPLVGGEYGMIPSRGSQFFFSTGFSSRFSIINFQFQPEIVSSQNLPFNGFPTTYSEFLTFNRFFYWNISDSPERFGSSSYTRFFFGQSYLSLKFGSFELGGGTKNFWWGPGQWNSLIFSNNSPGFPNVSFSTHKPAKTFLGLFEGHVLIGKLQSSNFSPTQNVEMDSKFFDPLNKDWRYLNGFLLSFSSKWLPGLSLGYSRTFQSYSSVRTNDLKGWFPILEPMAKEKLFFNGNAVIYDSKQQSQQIAIYGRYEMVQAKGEIYFQFGRRDHALNWREFILNPEHARAYQFGFIKLVDISSLSKTLQFRGEITNQQESVNRILRYDYSGGQTWHTHGQVRGFSNFGQPLGVGIGTGSNVQTLEISFVDDWNKMGILFERMENNQDFFNRAIRNKKEGRKPWIDWSTVLLWNTTYKDFFISARFQGTYARSYQWELSNTSTPEFPVSKNLFSFHSQVNLIYFLNRRFNKNSLEKN